MSEEKKEKPVLIKLREKVEGRLLEIAIVGALAFGYKMWDFSVAISKAPETLNKISVTLAKDTVRFKESIEKLNAKADSITVLSNEVKALKASNEVLMKTVEENYNDLTILYTEINALKNK